MTSKHVVIPGESQEEYEEFSRQFVADLKPQSVLERALADRIVAAAWRLKRFSRTEHAFFNDRVNAYLDEHPDADPGAGLANLFVDPVETARMRLFLRYQTSVQREYDKATAEFAKAQAARQQALFDEVLAESMRRPETVESEPHASNEFGFASQNCSNPEIATNSLGEMIPDVPLIARAAGRSAPETRALP